MPAYSFKERFIPLIKSGAKKQTIRAKRKGQAKPGSTLYLYYGMRTKWCTKILETTCTKVNEIVIKANGDIRLNGHKLSKEQKETLAVQDGFEDFKTMMRFWRITHDKFPFIGDVIYW